jgi:Putative transposase/Transposase zinc-binding domain
VVELAEVFRRYGQEYREKYGSRMPVSHLEAMADIEQCRTEVLGGQVYQCPECGEMRYSYHSCQNRHCPKCQNQAGQEWLEHQQALLLPVPYFLLTFTLPERLREVACSHQKLVYGLLFRASAAAAQQLAQDPRLVGGTLGMVGVLHTWTRALIYHPHIHYLVPGGGLAPDGRAWRPAREDFLLPVRALSVIFRAKFRDALQQTELFVHVPPEVWTQDWVVHCQPVGNGAAALKYLAPYIFRVAISNRRILSLEGDEVTFGYTDARSGQRKTCTLSAEEFIRRFLQHVLPKGFGKVRYYGLFSPARRQLLDRVRQLLSCAATPSEQDPASRAEALPAAEFLCPACGRPMQLVGVLRPRGRCPPEAQSA